MTPTLETVNLDEIRIGSNVRRDVGSVRELAYSLDSVGLLNPVTVRKYEGGAVELIAGHRRLEAARSLGWETIDAYVLDGHANLTDAAKADRVAVQLVENLQREDLSPLEEADGLAELVDLVGSQKAAAEAIGRSQAHVSKRLKLRQLPDTAREAIDSGAISLEEGFELSKVEDPKAVKKALDGLTGKGSRWELERTLKDQERDRASRKAARDVAKQDHRKGVEVVAVPDVPAGWKTLEGWDGLAVDQDAHEAEPCHRLVVGYQQAWSDSVSEVFYCADPARHDEDGESSVKVETTTREGDEAKRQAEAEARRQAEEDQRRKLWADASTIAGSLTDRNTALKILARFTLVAFAEEDGRLPAILEALDVETPIPPEKRPWEDPDGWKAYHAEISEIVEGLTVANLYRAAVLTVLDYTTHAPSYSPYGDELADTIAGLLEIPNPRKEQE